MGEPPHKSCATTPSEGCCGSTESIGSKTPDLLLGIPGSPTSGIPTLGNSLLSAFFPRAEHEHEPNTSTSHSSLKDLGLSFARRDTIGVMGSGVSMSMDRWTRRRCGCSAGRGNSTTAVRSDGPNHRVRVVVIVATFPTVRCSSTTTRTRAKRFSTAAPKSESSPPTAKSWAPKHGRTALAAIRTTRGRTQVLGLAAMHRMVSNLVLLKSRCG